MSLTCGVRFSGLYVHVSSLLHGIHYKLFHTRENAFHIMFSEAKEFGEPSTKKYRQHHEKACFCRWNKVNVEAFHSTKKKGEQQKYLLKSFYFYTHYLPLIYLTLIYCILSDDFNEIKYLVILT